MIGRRYDANIVRIIGLIGGIFAMVSVLVLGCCDVTKKTYETDIETVNSETRLSVEVRTALPVPASSGK